MKVEGALIIYNFCGAHARKSQMMDRVGCHMADASFNGVFGVR